MKKKRMLCAAAMFVALVVVPMAASAQNEGSTRGELATEPSFFIEAYLGGGAVSSSQKNNSITFTGEYDAHFIGGAKLGYWFTPYGTYAPGGMPEWMKYFGVYTDVSYQNLSHPNNVVNSYGFPVAIGNSAGYLVTWGFMLAARYGFLPDREIPFGRLQPYLAVGPALFFSAQDYNIYGYTQGYRSSTDIGLAAETGIRYFLTRNVSMQASFKYRYFSPSYYFRPFGSNLTPDTNLYSGQMGLAYHF